MLKITGKIHHVFFCSNDCYGIVVVDTDDGESVVVKGSMSLHPGIGCKIVACGSYVVDPKYGSCFVVPRDSVAEIEIKSRSAIIGYIAGAFNLIKGVTSAVCMRKANLFYNSLNLQKDENWIEKILSEDFSSGHRFYVSDSDIQVLKEVLVSDFPAVVLEEKFPTMKKHKGMARSIAKSYLKDGYSRGSMSALITSIFSNPYSLMGIRNVSLSAIDDVALNDLHVDVLSVDRGIAILSEALKQYERDTGATYVSLTDEKQAREFASVYLPNTGVLLPTMLKYSPYYTANGDAGLGNWFYNILSHYFGMGVPGKVPTVHIGGDFLVLECSGNGHPHAFSGALDGELRMYHSSVYQQKNSIACFCRDSIVRNNAFQTDMIQYMKRLKLLSDYKKRSCNLGKQSWVLMSDEQMSAVEMAVTNRLSFISGGPGRGKTSVVKCLVGFWREALGGDVLLFAPTGKASQRLKSMTGYEDTQTVKRFTVVNTIALGNGTVNDSYFIGRTGATYKNDPKTLIVVDEASMIDFEDVSAFLDFVSDCTVVFVGDKDQLPPVGLGAFLDEIVSSNALPMTVLTKNFRTNVAFLAHNSDLIASGEKVSAWDIKSDFNGHSFLVEPYTTEDMIVSRVIAYFNDFRANYANLDDILILSPTRRMCFLLNTKLQDICNKPRKADLKYSFNAVDVKCPHVFDPTHNTYDVRKYCDDVGCMIFHFSYYDGKASSGSSVNSVPVRVGDRVINTKNNVSVVRYSCDSKGELKESGSGVFNGDMGVVSRWYSSAVDSDLDFVRIDLDDGDVVFIDKADYSNWKLGYALTVHRSQGSEAKNVIVAFPHYCGGFLFDEAHGGRNPMMTRNLLYTAVTRAKESVILMGSIDAINRSVDTPYKKYNVSLAEAITA